MPIEISRIIRNYQNTRDYLISRYNDQNPVPDRLLEIIKKYNEMGLDPEYFINYQTLTYYAYKSCQF
jgi:hypothetical protein